MPKIYQFRFPLVILKKYTGLFIVHKWKEMKKISDECYLWGNLWSILRKHFPIFRNFSIVSGNIPQRTHKAFLHLLMPTVPSHTHCWLVRSKLVRIHWGLRFEQLFRRLFCVFKFLEVKKGPENFAALSESFVQGVLFCSVIIAISSIILSLMHSERGAATKRVKLYVNPGNLCNLWYLLFSCQPTYSS